MNYFESATAAARYARGRPYFHPLVMEKIRAFLQLRAPVPLGLDVACGTGQSAVALTELATEVIGLDPSPGMLAHARPHLHVRYVQGAAEALPFGDAIADLITVSLAFHWLDRARFLPEVRRVLKPGGTLIIYWNDFYTQMSENPDFKSWYQTVYFARYPTPPRNRAPFTDGELVDYGFHFVGREKHTNERVYTPEEFVQNLTTHSNVIALVEHGAQTIAEAEAWLLAEVRPLFRGPTGTFLFGGEIWYLRPT